jgi:hypothetical protein
MFSSELLSTPLHAHTAADAHRLDNVLSTFAHLNAAALNRFDLQSEAMRGRLKEFVTKEPGNLWWRAIEAALAAIGAKGLSAVEHPALTSSHAPSG